MKEENRLGKELKLMPETAPKVNSAAPFDHLEEQKMQGALRDSQGDPRKGPQEGWEAQWQEFLRTTQPIQAEWGDAMISEVDPWENAKAFLVSFEQVAKACRWPREEWSTRLLPTLTGEAEQAYRSLETTDREDYGKVKMAILQREALRMEMQRQHFRQFSCQEVEDPHKIYSQVQELCHQWLKPERHSKEQILELLILEQFLASLPPELQVWILAGGPDTCSQAVALAEEFLLSRQVAKTEKWQIAIKETGGGALHKGKKIVTDQKPETVLWEVLQEEDENGSALGDENGRQGKGENSVWNGNELEDAPRFISQINQKNVLEAAKKHEGSWRSRNQPWKQPLKRCNDFEQRTIISEKEDGLSNCGKEADWGGNLLKVEKSWCKENQPMDTTEMQAECCDAGEVQEKQPMKAENEVDKLTEGPTTSSKGYPRNEIPLSSLYSRIYQYGSEHATRHILDDPNECPNSVKTAQQNSCCGEHPTMVTGERGNLRCKYTKEGNLSWPQSHHAKEKLNRYPEPGNNIPVREKIKKLQKSKTKMNLYKCTVCSEPFMNKQYLKRTSKVHISEKQYECSLCERTFSRGDHLIRHKKSHEATRPHKCPDCERSFFRKDKLMRHRIMHEGSRVHKCSECDRSFTRRDNMIRHRRTHEGTKYYSCLNVRKFEQPLEQPMTYIDRIVFGNCSPTT